MELTRCYGTKRMLPRAYVGKEKQKGLDLYVLDVTDKDNGERVITLRQNLGSCGWTMKRRPRADGSVKFKRSFRF